jgi:membrane associated rhomboid family serine protease
MKSGWKLVGALGGMMVLAHIVNILTGGYLNNFGIEPRKVGDAYTVATAPFIHADVAHLGNNLLAFLVLAALVMLQGVRYFIKASAIIVLLGGALVWLFARPGEHIGASGWIFGLWSLTIALAWFDRSPRNIAIALAVLFFYGGMVFGVLPTDSRVSFEAHLFGAIAGVVAAFTLSKTPTEVAPPERAGELKFWPQDKMR